MIRTAQLLADIVAGHQGEKARIVSHLADSAGLSAREVSNVTKIPLSTCYKHLAELLEAALVARVPTAKKKELWACPGFDAKLQFDIRKPLVKLVRGATPVPTPSTRAMLPKVLILLTARNLPVFLAAEFPAAKLFIDRHGWPKYVRFAQLYEEYRAGTLPVFLMAKELGVTEFEVSVVISDIEAFLKGKTA